jgi:hypothetical protein
VKREFFDSECDQRIGAQITSRRHFEHDGSQLPEVGR